MAKITLIILAIVSFGTAYAGEAAHWYFGKYAGLEFTKAGPVVSYEGRLDTEEGATSVSDKEDNLLFYSDGVTVFNREHNTMSNGTDLLGHVSSTQSALAFEFPMGSSSYYIFTCINLARSEGLNYSAVNLSADEGRGEVTTKNIYLAGPVGEKLCAYRSAKYGHALVLSHFWNSDEYVAFLIDDNGVISQPVTSKGAARHEGINQNTTGAMKISPDGKYTALCLRQDSKIEVGRFDEATGQVTDSRTADLGGLQPYGIEFSPDGKYIYVSTLFPGSVLLRYKTEEIFQGGMPYEIIAEEEAGDFFGALQLAEDGRIYVARNQSTYLAAITKPLAEDCGYVRDAIDLMPGVCGFGLPGFPAEIFYSPDPCELDISSLTEEEIEKDIYLLGDAEMNNGAIKLTEASELSGGALYFRHKVNVRDGFHMKVAFNMKEGDNNNKDEGSSPGADGVALVIQDNAAPMLGGLGGGMGYDKVPRSLAVELDSYRNFPDYDDPNGSHVAVMSGGTGENDSRHTGNFTRAIADLPFDLVADGGDYHIMLNYGDGRLQVFAGRDGDFQAPLIDMEDFDIGSLIGLDESGKAFVGVSSSTGSAWETHEVTRLNWCDYPLDMGSGVQTEQEGTGKILEIFPNPAVDRLFITGIHDFEKIEIYDGRGRLAHSVDKSKAHVDVSFLQSGTYFVRACYSSIVLYQKLLILK